VTKNPESATTEFDKWLDAKRPGRALDGSIDQKTKTSYGVFALGNQGGRGISEQALTSVEMAGAFIKPASYLMFT